ncbi:MAG: hypothetical protein IJH60_02980 [Eubacterium sp.]|nr:hypothetical protein [Eubacterium sp.]
MPVAHNSTQTDAGSFPDDILVQKEAEIMKTVSVIEETMTETRKIFERIEKSIDEIKKVYTKTKPVTMTEGALGKAPAI